MVEFTRLFETGATRDSLIVTFLAILEMARLKMLQVTQSESYGEIYLVPHFEAVDVRNLGENVTLQ
jgi:segregation and condensation protein A